jgi:hypothetical protein
MWLPVGYIGLQTNRRVFSRGKNRGPFFLQAKQDLDKEPGEIYHFRRFSSRGKGGDGLQDEAAGFLCILLLPTL